MAWDFLEWFFIQGKLQGAGPDRAWLVLEGELPTGSGFTVHLVYLWQIQGRSAPKALRKRARRNIKTSAGLCPTEPRAMMKSP